TRERAQGTPGRSAPAHGGGSGDLRAAPGLRAAPEVEVAPRVPGPLRPRGEADPDAEAGARPGDGVGPAGAPPPAGAPRCRDPGWGRRQRALRAGGARGTSAADESRPRPRDAGPARRPDSPCRAR